MLLVRYCITVFPQSDVTATIQGQCLTERIQSEWYSAVVVPESHFFLSLLLQCWAQLYHLRRTLCPLESSTYERKSQDRRVSLVTLNWGQVF